MDTLRVDICYRPLRLAWAIMSGDLDSFRRAVRTSHTMWGGRFNPIVLVDRPEAHDLVGLFRADVIVPLGEAEELKAFAAKYPHLIRPYFPDMLFMKDRDGTGSAHVLDIHNALVHFREKAAWKHLTEQGLRTFSWDHDDPLKDIFLVQYGAYPPAEEVGIDYLEIVAEAAQPSPLIDIKFQNNRPIPPEVLAHPSLAFLSKHGLYRHHSLRPGWDFPGVFVGTPSDIDDLVSFWNLRAADISLQFIDPDNFQRFDYLRPEWERRLRESLSRLAEHHRKPAAWSRREQLDTAVKLLFPQGGVTACGIDPLIWKGGAICPPMMIFGEESALGVVADDRKQPRVSFALANKPISADNWFYTQHLVASLSMTGAIERDSPCTFHPPHVPELNEFFARSMQAQYNRLRIEPERVGLVINAATHSAVLGGLPVAELIEQLFALSGLDAKPSGAGLITRQLIARLGGVDGARVFKIPGVRRLIKTYGPTEGFTKRAALQLIGSKDPNRPTSSFKDHENLYIEPRTPGTKLTAEMVFSFLVGKGLFRIGVELTCPVCNLPSWIALDQLQQSNVCELCGSAYDATRQLVKSEFRYRRTGVLGLEKNAQGAIPVALLLQQLAINVSNLGDDGIFMPSLDLAPKSGSDVPACEIDFFVLLPGVRLARATILLGECKDEGGKIDAKDVENMRRIADALPSDRFNVFILFAKLSAFTEPEIALTQSLNSRYTQRVILLTERELEPYHLYERTIQELRIEPRGGTPEDLARVTADIYFKGT